MASKVKLDLRFEISNLSYHGIDVHIASNSYLGGLWGHGSLQTASLAPEVKFDLKFEISNLIYPGIHVHVASNSHFGGLWGCGSLQTSLEAAGSEAKSRNMKNGYLLVDLASSKPAI